MRILRRGSVQPAVFRGECSSCKTAIECDRGELAIQWDGREQGELAQVECPVCHASLWVYPHKAEAGWEDK